MTVTTEQLTEFCAAVVRVIEAYETRMGYREGICHKHITAEAGPKYARIVVRRTPEDQHGSAYGFVRLEDGAILKAAGWKAPAKHVRGWINDPASVAKACGPHGIAYLR